MNTIFINPNLFSADSIQSVTYTSAELDSLADLNRAPISVWLQTVTTGSVSFYFWESLILLISASVFATLLNSRRERVKRNDAVQARALRMAIWALGMLALKGAFFVFASFALTNVIPPQSFGYVYWLGWQVSLLWFVFFAYFFAMSFVRSKRSYDIYHIANVTGFFSFFMLAYNEWTWKTILYAMGLARTPGTTLPVLKLGEEYKLLNYASYDVNLVTLHFIVWILFLGYASFRLYQRTRSYQDSSARDSLYVLVWVYLGLTSLGVVGLVLLYSNRSLMTSQSYLIAILMSAAFYFGVRNVFRHGRYKRV